MYRHRRVFNSFSSAFFKFYCNLHSILVWNATTVRFANNFVLYISFQLPFAFAAFFFTVYPPYQLRIFPVNSLLISTRNERRFSILVETLAISPAIINLSTRASTNFHFQNQTANSEDKTAGNAVLVYAWRRGVLQSLNDSGLLCAFCALQVFTVFFVFSPHPPPLPMAQQLLVRQRLLVIEASRSHSFRHATLGRAPLDE